MPMKPWISLKLTATCRVPETSRLRMKGLRFWPCVTEKASHKSDKSQVMLHFHPTALTSDHMLLAVTTADPADP